jgi:CDP-diacylglycerol--glycerol-3-phosphate 3-phosphatidyltransferase
MSMNLPNKLTMFRVVLIPVFIVVLMSGLIAEPASRYIAVVIFCVASFTDYLDGHIARKYNLVTNFGKFMDPLADKLLVSAAMICMIELGMLPALVVIIIISREFIITGFRLIAAEGGLVIAASWWGKIKTVTQMAMIILMLLGVNKVIGTILVVLATIFTVVSGVDYIVKNISVLKN